MAKTHKPEFCFITPIDYLQYALGSNTHLVLAHLVAESDRYANFYKTCSDNGDYVIMDNSAYELKEPYTPGQLISLGHRCGANAVVLPDYPFQEGVVTVRAAEEYIDDFKAEGFDTFFVPQSKTGDIDDWLATYRWAAENPKIDIIGMSILGVPNALPHIHPAYARVVMAQKLLDSGTFNHDKHHHYLGLNTGPALEIPSLLDMGVLDSIDSSGPVWAGILGHKYTSDADSFQMVSKLKMPVNFHQPMTNDPDTKARIDHNVKMTYAMMMEHERAPWYAQE